MEEGVPRASVHGVGIGPPFDEPGGEGVRVLAHVFAREVSVIELFEGQPQRRLPVAVAEVKVQPKGSRVPDYETCVNAYGNKERKLENSIW